MVARTINSRALTGTRIGSWCAPGQTNRRPERRLSAGLTATTNALHDRRRRRNSLVELGVTLEHKGTADKNHETGYER